MSLDAWCNAVLETVTDELVDVAPAPKGVIGLADEPGMPPPTCGWLYVAVYPAGWRPNGSVAAYRLEEEYSVGIALTRRFGMIPKSRESFAWNDVTLGLEPLARRIICRLMNKQIDVMQLAANKIDGAGDLVNASIEPLVFAVAEGPTTVGVEWFAAAGQGNEKPAGKVLHLTFSGGKRVQEIGGAT